MIYVNILFRTQVGNDTWSTAKRSRGGAKCLHGLTFTRSRRQVRTVHRLLPGATGSPLGQVRLIWQGKQPGMEDKRMNGLL